ELVETISDEHLEGVAHDGEHLRLLKAFGARSCICVPISSQGRALGGITFVLTRADRTYTKGDLVAAQDLANRTAVAIRNASLYRALKEADRRKDEFLATLAHELRNPLAPLRNALHILDVSADAETNERARMVMERQLEQMVRLVDDLMDLSRIS